MEVVERVTDVLGGRAVLRKRVRSWRDLEHVVRAGLPKKSLQLVARHVERLLHDAEHGLSL